MFDTSFTRRFGLTAPIINAGMAFVAGPALVAAVANAGAFGMLGGAMVPPEGLRAMIRATRALTTKPFGVDLIGDFVVDAHIDVVIEEQVSAVVFFWSAPSRGTVERLKKAGIFVMMQVGRVAEALEASALGVDALIVQGAEAGGHNRSEARLAALLPVIGRELPGVPLIAAGGIIDGARMAAALAIGAEAVWCGTRFLASEEADAHEGYKARVVAAEKDCTSITTVFGPEWPGQPLRALVNRAVRCSAGREAEALAEAAEEVIGSTMLGGEVVPVPRYSALLPTRAFEADLEWSCLTAGEAAAEVQSVEPAHVIVGKMMAEARAVRAQRAA